MSPAHRVCPWWLGYLLASPLRRLAFNPGKLLAPYVRPGMTVLEPGPGMGFFTLELALRVGPSGRVIAIDIQERMLNRLKRRAAKAGVIDRVEARLAAANSLGISDLAGKVDFTLAFAVVHEMPSAASFFGEVAQASKPGAQILFAEPAGHVKKDLFEEEIEAAVKAGLAAVSPLSVKRSQAVLLRKQAASD